MSETPKPSGDVQQAYNIPKSYRIYICDYTSLHIQNCVTMISAKRTRAFVMITSYGNE